MGSVGRISKRAYGIVQRRLSELRAVDHRRPVEDTAHREKKAVISLKEQHARDHIQTLYSARGTVSRASLTGACQQHILAVLIHSSNEVTTEPRRKYDRKPWRKGVLYYKNGLTPIS
jgi:hypothetical protein